MFLIFVIVIFSSITFISPASQVVAEEHHCISGSTWRDQCNDCYCDNGIPFCSALVCQLPKGVYQRPCLTGTTWQKDCNNCSCNNGVPVCRNLPCPPKYTYLPPGLTINKKCVHGTTWKIGCVDCFCHHGLTACSIKSCNKTNNDSKYNLGATFWNPTVIFPVGLNQKNSCIEGTSWKNGCNDCFCSNGIPACTLKSCNDSGQLNEKCAAGTVWKQDCNQCYCHEGVPACTSKICPPRTVTTKIPAKPEEECKNGMFWQNDCNNCTCVRGKTTCTSAICANITSTVSTTTIIPTTTNIDSTPVETTISTTREEFKNKTGCECVVGATWKEDCNECSCPFGFRTCISKSCTTMATLANSSSILTSSITPNEDTEKPHTSTSTIKSDIK